MARPTVLMVLVLLAGACSSSTSDSPSLATEPTAQAEEPAVAEPTPAAEPSATPEPTAVPEPSATPESTALPEPSATPGSTATSEPAAVAPTIDELLAEDSVVNLAHAGGDQSWPHSTPYAFAEAVKAGAGVLELDVQLTGDGVLVVQHDDTVDKTTEATGPVIDLTLAELQALDNAYWFSPECWPCQDRPLDEYIYRGVRTGDTEPPAGYTADDFRVATFREIAERFPTLPLDIEIKGELPQAGIVAEVLAAELDELGRTDSVVVVSFDDEVIDAFRALAPDVAVSPGTTRLTTWVLAGTPLEDGFEIIQVPPESSGVDVVTPESVARAHDEGLTIWVWPNDAETQENEAFYRQLVELGVDGVIAGRPEEMAAATAG